MTTDLPKKSRRVVFAAPKDVVLDEIDMRPPKEGEILIKTIASTISIGTELTILSGDFPKESKWAEYARYPFVAGYSNCGEVIATGPGVENVSVGDRVVTYAPHAQYAIMPATSVFARVPDSVDAKAASTFALGLIATNGVRRGQPQLGESAVVYGLGILGQLVVQLLRLCGCRPVIGVDLSEQRRRWAKELGADVVLDGAGDVPAGVREATKGRMADLLFEVTGYPSAIPEEFKSLKKFGRAVLLSSPRGPCQFDFHDFCNSPSITIIGAHNSSTPACETVFSQWTWPRNCELYLDLIALGDLQVGKMISHVFSFEQAPEVYRRLIEDRGWASFIVFDWT